MNKTNKIYLISFTLLAIIFVIGGILITNVMAERNERLENELIYTYNMKYVGKNEGVTIDSVRLFPNQLLKDESAQLEIVLENQDDYSQEVTIEVRPYNTDKILFEPSYITTTFDSRETKKADFSFLANDLAGIYFITNLEISVYDIDRNLLDQQKVPIIITTDLEESKDELLDWWYLN